MSEFPFLQNLALVLGVAALTTVLFQKLHQPLIVGYLLAGMIVGPHVPIPLVADPEIIHTLSELEAIEEAKSILSCTNFSASKIFPEANNS